MVNRVKTFGDIKETRRYQGNKYIIEEAHGLPMLYAHHINTNETRGLPHILSCKGEGVSLIRRPVDSMAPNGTLKKEIRLQTCLLITIQCRRHPHSPTYTKVEACGLPSNILFIYTYRRPVDFHTHFTAPNEACNNTGGLCNKSRITNSSRDDFGIYSQLSLARPIPRGAGTRDSRARPIS